MGMIVLAGGRRMVGGESSPSSSACSAVLGQAVTYHYFTDTVGAVLLGTAVVCVAALAAKLDTCQPACDADHTSR